MSEKFPLCPMQSRTFPSFPPTRFTRSPPSCSPQFCYSPRHGFFLFPSFLFYPQLGLAVAPRCAFFFENNDWLRSQFSQQIGMHFVAGFSRFVIPFHQLDSTILLFLSGKPLSFAHSESGTLGRGNNVLLPRRNRADGREKNWVFSCRSSGSGVDFFSSRPRLRFSFFASYRDSAFASSLSLAAHYFSFSFPRSLQHRLFPLPFYILRPFPPLPSPPFSSPQYFLSSPGQSPPLPLSRGPRTE